MTGRRRGNRRNDSRTIDKHERLLLNGIQNQIIAKGDTAVQISTTEMHTLTGIGENTVKEAKERLDGKFPWLEISNKSKTATYRIHRQVVTAHIPGHTSLPCGYVCL